VTSQVTLGARTEPLRLSIRFRDSREALSLGVLSDRIGSLRDLLLAGYWIDWRFGESEGAANPRRAVRDDLTVKRLSYSSPLVMILEISPYAASAVGAARGVVYLMSRWEDWREKRAMTDMRVSTYKLIEASLPDRVESLPAGLLLDDRPGEIEMQNSSWLATQIESIKLDEQGSDPDRQ
jgi:hypothetical protein